MSTRRDFITLLGGAAAAWPVAARAQQRERVRRVGMLTNLAADDPLATARVAAFAQAMQELGWIVGRNLQIDYRWGQHDPDRLRKYAAELVALGPEVIVANATPSTAALQQATRSVPVVFVNQVDPVGAGFVESLARPGGNVTGFTNFEYGLGAKWLELLKRLRRASCASLSYAIRPARRGPASLAPSSPWRLRLGWSCGRSTYAILARSSARSRPSRTHPTAA
jgi:putative tryptophan/tyrosine transport system substrate-binding protein